MSEWDSHIPGGALDMFPQENRNPGYQYGLDANQLGTWLDYHHNLLSETHSDTTSASPVRGDIITAQGASAKWTRLARSVPLASGLLNVLGFKLGDTEPTYYAAEHDVLSARHSDALTGTVVLGDLVHGNVTPKWARLAGNITATKKFLTQTGSGAASAVPAWDTIAVADVPAHNLLSATHGDTLADSVVRGDIVYGNSTPKWARLAKPSAGALLTHDATDVAWDTMAWTTPSFDAANFTGGGGTWTVGSGDVITYAYRMIGSKTMVISFTLDTTSVSGTTATLSIKVPNSKTTAKTMTHPVFILDNLARTTGIAIANAGGTTIGVSRTDAANFTASANQTYIYGQITLEVQ